MVLRASASALSLLLLPQSVPNWTQVGAPGAYTFVASPDYASDGIVWYVPATLNYQGGSEIHVVSDHGSAVQFWSTLPGIGHEMTTLAISPTFASDSTIIATSIKNLDPASRLWKSTDAGLSWTEMPQPAALTWGNVFKSVTLSPAFDNDEIILASCGGFGCQTHRSDDGGVSWPLIAPISFRMKDINFATDFATSGFAYGIKADGSPSFMRSSNFGMSFTNCSHPLSNPGLCPNLDGAWGLAVAPVGPTGVRRIYYHGRGTVADPENFIRSNDNGSNWHYAGAGLAGLQVFDLVVADDGLGTGTLYAATDAGVYPAVALDCAESTGRGPKGLELWTIDRVTERHQW